MIKYAVVNIGIGGFHEAFNQALNGKAECVWTSEPDSPSALTYEWNYHQLVDSRNFRSVDPRRLPNFDVLCVKFNTIEDCDDLTAIAQLVTVKKPYVVLIEASPLVKTALEGSFWAELIDHFEYLQYHVAYAELNAANYSAQSRKRLYMVGCKSSSVMAHLAFPEAVDEGWAVSDILEADSAVEERYDLSMQSIRRFMRQAHWRLTIVDLNGKTRTLTPTYDKSRKEIIVQRPDGRLRMLTPRECARLVGFPDTFEIIMSHRVAYRQFGESVSVVMAARVITELARSLGFTDEHAKVVA